MKKITEAQFNSAPHLVCDLDVGDKVIRSNPIGYKIGTLYKKERLEYWFKWDNGDENTYINKNDLMNSDRTRLYEEADVPTEPIPHADMIEKILDIYCRQDCPTWSMVAANSDKCVEYIIKALKKDSDPEYAEYLRLKEKYETNH